MSSFLTNEISWEALPLVTSFSNMIKIYNSELYAHFFLWNMRSLYFWKTKVIFKVQGASLVIQWKPGPRISLAMYRAPVRSLVQEDSTCHGATKPMRHNYWSPCALEIGLHNKRSHHSEKRWRLKRSPCSLPLQKDPAATKTHCNPFKKENKNKRA